MIVTKDNFDVFWTEVLDTLKEGSIIALDLEMTGI